jgi:hypothetical protein
MKHERARQRALGKIAPPASRLTLALTFLTFILCTSASARSVGQLDDTVHALSFGTGHIAGKVTSAAGGGPLEQIEVCAEDPGIAYCATTTASGEYEVGGLPAGQYDVRFSPREQNFLPQYYSAKASRAEAISVGISEGATASGIDAALIVGGIIEGEVSSAATGNGLAGVLVCARPVDVRSEYFGECATSEASGHYAIERLGSAAYTVQFDPQTLDYATQYYNGKSLAAQANQVQASAGGVVSGIDAKMQVGGEIAGTVTLPHGAPSEGIEVCATAVGAEPWQSQCTHTEASGNYTIARLASAEYTVVFHGAGNLLTQYYRGRATPAEAEPVQVTSGSATRGIDATLQEGGSITGKITDALSGAPIEGIQACAQTSASGRVCATNDSNSAGEYKVEGLASGSYAVEFQTWGENYLSAYYAGARFESEATRVAVVAGTTVAGIDVALQPGGEITGTVLAQGSDAPIEGAQVCARGNQPRSVNFYECVPSGAGGHYTLTKLHGGSYDVQFSAAGYVTQYYDEANHEGDAESVTVSEGTSTPEINAAMQQSASIAGRVTSASGGGPLADIQVCASQEVGEGGPCASTNANGEYTITGLATAEYTVGFSGAGYPAQYYPGTFSSGEATRVGVSAGHTTASVDTVLHEGGSISGSVTSATTGAPLEGMSVCARRRIILACTHSDATGQYTISGLAPGLYTVGFEASAGYLQTNAVHRVTVASEIAVTGVSAEMQPGGRITGQVREATNDVPLEGVQVCSYQSNENRTRSGPCVKSEVNGDYAIEDLASGEWEVEFIPRDGKLARQFFSDASTFESATPISVTAGQTSEDVNATLTAGGQISGTVTDNAGAPLEDARVCADPTEEPSENICAKTGTDGTYAISALSAGPYKVEFNAKGYSTQYYGNAYWSVLATTVNVTAGVNSEGIDAQLHGGGTITGTVSDAATGQPLAGIEVCSTTTAPEGEWPPFFELFPYCIFTGATGEYTLPELRPGEHEISFTSPTHAFASWHTKKVVATAEQTNAGVNAALAPAGKISGQVTNEVGAGFEGIDVCATNIDSPESNAGCATTNAKGDYTIAGLQAASYYVHFEIYDRNYAAQYFSGASMISEARLVTVIAGETVRGVDAQLRSGGEISGTVIAAAGGEPLEFVIVCALSETEGSLHTIRCAQTEPEGQYTITGLPSGSYRVRFVGGGYNALQYYNGTYSASEATAVTVRAGAESTGIDAAMSLGAVIRGKVTAAADGSNIKGVKVCANPIGETQSMASCRQTSANGEYTIPSLDPDSYVVEFSDKGKYQTEFYKGAGTLEQATDLTVALGATSEGIDAQMVGLDAAPYNTSPPLISGSPSVGSTLTCTPGTWLGEPAPTYVTQWLRGGLPIAGAIGASYTLTTADDGQQIACEVTATNQTGSSIAVSSAASVSAGQEPGGGGPGVGGGPSGGSSSGAGGSSSASGGGPSGGVSRYKATVQPAPRFAGAIRIRGNEVLVPLRCPTTSVACLQVTVTVSVVETFASRLTTAVGVAHQGRAIEHALVIGSAKVTLVAAHRADVLVHLDASGRRLLRHHGGLTVLVQLKARGSQLASRIVRLSTK